MTILQAKGRWAGVRIHERQPPLSTGRDHALQFSSYVCRGRAIVEALNALTAHVTLRTLQLLMKGHLHQGVKKQCADTYGIQYFFR